MGLWGWFKSLTVVHILMAYIFLASGIITNIFMLCGLVLWPINKNLYRKYMTFWTYAYWSQFSFLGNWWTESECTLYVSPEDREKFGKEHNVCIINHSYEVDWLMAWMMAERHGMLGNTKVYAKEILKYVPIIGWTWAFTESIFLKRDWKKDNEILRKSIGALVTYPDHCWINLLLFPEGTRWTPEKHEACLKVAREKGYPQYKHVLLPRTKGFAYSMQLMKGKIPTVLDITVGFPEGEREPTLMDAVSGKKIKCAMIARSYAINDIPSDSEEECGNWLRELYLKKDNDLEHYKQTGTFEGLPAGEERKRCYDLIWYIVWTIVTGIPLGYYLVFLITAASLIHQLTVAGLFIGIMLLVKWMISFTQVKYGTAYGLTKEQREKLGKAQ